VSTAVSPQVTVTNPAVGSHYFPQGVWLPSQPQSITDFDGQRTLTTDEMRTKYCEAELIILLGNGGVRCISSICAFGQMCSACDKLTKCAKFDQMRVHLVYCTVTARYRKGPLR